MAKIILIEDDMTMLSLLTTLLEMEGFQVLTMGDDTLENVLIALHRDPPDVALMDVHLRLLNGMDLLRRIRQDHTLDKIRVIMCSGMDLSDECLQAGASAFMLKPYMPDDLINEIQKVISQ